MDYELATGTPEQVLGMQDYPRRVADEARAAQGHLGYLEGLGRPTWWAMLEARLRAAMLAASPRDGEPVDWDEVEAHLSRLVSAAVEAQDAAQRAANGVTQ
jgi:hypothetical protein